MVRGKPRHVVGYLKEFLFAEAQARGPVSALSGGEKARLLLARLMARDSNLLILDEPTNDLDVETLDLLQELVDDYDGTVLLVSHDRDFVDRIATTTIAMEGNGRAEIYAGGWSDYQLQRREAAAPPPPLVPKPRGPRRKARPGAARPEAHLHPVAPAGEAARRDRASRRRDRPPRGGCSPIPTSTPATPRGSPRRLRRSPSGRPRSRRAEEEWLELEAMRETSAG